MLFSTEVIILDSDIGRTPHFFSQLPLVAGVASCFISFLKLPKVFGELDWLSLPTTLPPTELSSIAEDYLNVFFLFPHLTWSDTLFWHVEVSGFTVNYCVCTFQPNMLWVKPHSLGERELVAIHNPKWLP